LYAKIRLSLAATLLMAVGALLPSPGVAAAAGPVPVASGFDSPRGVDFFKGKLVVGEAGHGGTNCIPAGPSNPLTCFGRTSQISWVNTATGTHSTLVDHLFSVAEFRGPGPGEALGVDGVSARGGQLMAIEGVFPQAFASFPCAPGDTGCAADLAAATNEAGALLAVRSNGSWRKVAGVGAFGFDFTANIPNQEHDSNPYGVLATSGGAYVADAGSNTLNFVSNGGHISVLHYFPFRNNAGFPTDEVPNCIVKADDGLWVATLSGHLYRVHGTSATLVPNALLKHVTGCTADRSGNVYFVNMWTTPTFPTPFTGDIVKMSDEGTSSVIASGINFPNMDVIGPNGNLYFSADSVCPAAGVTGLCPSGGTVWKLAVSNENGESDE
jgi:hypothetical protein